MLDDAQLRTLEERLRYLRELEDRRSAVLDSVREQGKLTEDLEARILGADTKARLEDIYLPFKPKRRTKAQIAREAGLEPLAEGLLADPSVEPSAAAAAFVDADKGSRTRRRPWRARGRSSRRSSPRTPTSSASCASACGAGAVWWRRCGTARATARRAGGEVRRLLRLRRAVHGAALAPGARHAARREGGRARPGPGAGGARRGPFLVRGDRRAPLRRGRPGAPRGQVAPGHRPLGLADPDPGAPRDRPAAAAADGRRGRGRAGLRGEPAGPAARRAGRHPGDPGPRPRFPDGREGRRRGRDRQGRRHRHDPPPRPGEQVGPGPGDPRAAREGARGRAGRDRQRHGLPRDRQAGGRTRRRAPRAEPDQGDGLGGRRLGLLGLRVRLAGTPGPGRVVARRRLHRPAAPGPAGGAGEDRPEVDRRRPVPARPGRGEARARSTRWSRTV